MVSYFGDHRSGCEGRDTPVKLDTDTVLSMLSPALTLRAVRSHVVVNTLAQAWDAVFMPLVRGSTLQ